MKTANDYIKFRLGTYSLDSDDIGYLIGLGGSTLVLLALLLLPFITSKIECSKITKELKKCKSLNEAVDVLQKYGVGYRRIATLATDPRFDKIVNKLCEDKHQALLLKYADKIKECASTTYDSYESAKSSVMKITHGVRDYAFIICTDSEYRVIGWIPDSDTLMFGLVFGDLSEMLGGKHCTAVVIDFRGDDVTSEV